MGENNPVDRTDPDYWEHRMERMVNDYLSLDRRGKETFLGGLHRRDHDELLERVAAIKAAKAP